MSGITALSRKKADKYIAHMARSCMLRMFLAILVFLKVVGGHGVVMRVVVELFIVGMVMLNNLELDFHRMLVSILQLLQDLSVQSLSTLHTELSFLKQKVCQESNWHKPYEGLCEDGKWQGKGSYVKSVAPMVGCISRYSCMQARSELKACLCI